MTETAKTLAFMAAGAVAILAAFVVAPSDNRFEVEELVGQKLYQFEVDAPKRLKIIKFDSETATPREFEVAEQDGLWTIPSKQGYPADATRQMAEAATCLIDREILRVASTSKADHEQLGVLDPSTVKLKSQADGVGTRVIMTDGNNKELVDMIVGKKVREAEGQHYVRNTQQDIVYVVSIDPSKLTTRFDDWIEDDLLKISPFDIRRVAIKDYTAEMMLTLQGFKVNWDRRAEMTLAYNNTESKWSAESLKKFDPTAKDYVEYKIPEGSELDEETLNTLRDGLDDLLIVDVERKPAGLSADLKAGEDFVKNEEAALNLMERGFAPVATGPEKQADILSTEGEVVCTLQDGVEYVLRFGNLQLEGDGGDPASAGDEEGEDGEAKSKSDNAINRYLFVMARYNESMIEKPELDELPELPAGATASDKPAPGESASESGEGPAQDEPASGEPASAGGDVEEEEEEEETSEVTESAEAEPAAGEPASTEAASGEPASAPGEPASAGGEANETEPASEGEDTGEESASEEKDKELADIIEARKQIEQENQRRLDEYQGKINNAKQQVTKLNERFGDWYYVISNDVYQQIHLSLDDLIKVKQAEGESASADGETDAAQENATGLPNLPFSNPPTDE